MTSTRVEKIMKQFNEISDTLESEKLAEISMWVSMLVPLYKHENIMKNINANTIIFISIEWYQRFEYLPSFIRSSPLLKYDEILICDDPKLY